MANLYGDFSHNIDDKGRLIIPSKFRDALGEHFIVTKGLDRCLFVFSEEEWQNFEKRIRELSFYDKDARNFTRFFFAGASDCTLDKQGRITIPPILRDYANLTKETRIIGVSTRLEIWEAGLWEETSNIDATILAERMSELGI